MWRKIQPVFFMTTTQQFHCQRTMCFTRKESTLKLSITSFMSLSIMMTYFFNYIYLMISQPIYSTNHKETIKYSQILLQCVHFSSISPQLHNASIGYGHCYTQHIKHIINENNFVLTTQSSMSSRIKAMSESHTSSESSNSTKTFDSDLVFSTMNSSAPLKFHYIKCWLDNLYQKPQTHHFLK